MSFSSFIFLIRFLPAALILYYLFPQKGRNALLVTFSLLFYTWGDPSSLPFLLLSALVGYAGGLLAARLPKGRKAALTVSLLLILGSLAFYKYLGFFIENLNRLFLESAGIGISVPELTAPAGISFFSSASSRSCVMSVAMKPGATAFTVTLRAATSCANALVAPISAALAAA